jgi:heme/copper-type cytochrome/quinol oxidase subunit 2
MEGILIVTLVIYASTHTLPKSYARDEEMSLDIVMMALVLSGLALTITYFYVAVLLWRQHARREGEKEAAQRKLHADRLRASNTASPARDKTAPSDRQIAA